MAGTFCVLGKRFSFRKLGQTYRSERSGLERLLPGGRSRFFANGIIFVLRAYKNNKISANDRKLG